MVPQPHGSASPYLLAFGDSLTAGYGLPRRQSFPAQLEALLQRRSAGARVENAGVSGDTTGSALARLPCLLSSLAQRPDLAVVALGANDMLRFVAPERIWQNLDAILALFAQCGIPVLLAGMRAPLLLGPLAYRLNAIYPDLAAKYVLPLYPFFLEGAMGPGMTLADGMHPNARAVSIVARNLEPVVLAALGNRAMVA